MFSLKKAQAAVEYLQTYGWAILVIIIVGIAVWQLGILGPHGRMNRATGFTKLKILDSGIKYHEDMDTNTLNFTLFNPTGNKIEVETANVSGDCIAVWFNYGTDDDFTQGECDALDGIFSPPDWCVWQKKKSIQPGETTSVVYSFCTPLHEGEQFEVNINFLYKIKIGTQFIDRYDSGTIRGYAG